MAARHAPDGWGIVSEATQPVDGRRRSCTRGGATQEVACHVHSERRLSWRSASRPRQSPELGPAHRPTQASDRADPGWQRAALVSVELWIDNEPEAAPEDAPDRVEIHRRLRLDASARIGTGREPHRATQTRILS